MLDRVNRPGAQPVVHHDVLCEACMTISQLMSPRHQQFDTQAAGAQAKDAVVQAARDPPAARGSTAALEVRGRGLWLQASQMSAMGPQQCQWAVRARDGLRPGNRVAMLFLPGPFCIRRSSSPAVRSAV